MPLGDNRAMPLPRLLATLLIAVGLILLAISHYRYGLAEQSGILLSVLPLLFAGLLLGRRGLWITTVAYLGILALGSWSDLRHGVDAMPGSHEFVASLLQPVLGCAIVALILDRLILQSDLARRRNRELERLYRQLQVEMQEKERSQAQLIHSQRMDSLGKLAGSVSHDFNNLLSVILGYATQRLDADAPVRVAQERMDKIAAATQRGKRLTDRLLTLARADALVSETFDARAALEDMLPMVRSMCGAGVRVRAAITDEAAWVHLDPAEFEASLLNLVKNACDAMAEGGELRIDCARVDDEVCIAIADDGCGMAPDVAARVFEPFFTTKPSSKGTGIGLAVVYRTVTEAGGRIDVDSAPGAGARFTLRLPRRQQPRRYREG